MTLTLVPSASSANEDKSQALDRSIDAGSTAKHLIATSIDPIYLRIVKKAYNDAVDEILKSAANNGDISDACSDKLLEAKVHRDDYNELLLDGDARDFDFGHINVSVRLNTYLLMTL
jgi:hypothetical protein